MMIFMKASLMTNPAIDSIMKTAPRMFGESLDNIVEGQYGVPRAFAPAKSRWQVVPR